MERYAMQELIDWKASAIRKPLIINGARQTGKTWLLKEFGRLHYKNIAYFNFDETSEYKQFFELTKDPARIIEYLSLASGESIHPEETLIIFDEIQECGEALNSLKYFYEKVPSFHIACAGSLLGVKLAKPQSFPVGKVDFLNLYPMCFEEFLLADKESKLVKYLHSIQEIEAIPDLFYNQLCEKLKVYYIVGGMPEIVSAWVEHKDITLIQRLQDAVLNAYKRDFVKHTENREFPKLSLIWHSIPSQFAKENKKFLYSVIKKGARAREYEDALTWLCNANLLFKCYRNKALGLPMSAYDDISAFKIFFLDVGLLRRLSRLSYESFKEGSKLFVEFKGAFTENFVFQSLYRQIEVEPRYWRVDNPKYEIDFLIQIENAIYPIEVKSDKNIESKSLRMFKKMNPTQTRLRVRYSLANLCLHDDVLNIPLFMADRTKELIEIAIQSMQS